MPGSLVYLNGAFVPRHAATLDLEDRGALFADGVYEVIRYYHGRPLAMDEHLARLRASLKGIWLPEPGDLPRFPALSDELVARNGLAEAKVYWQVTRGAAPREHAFPRGVEPTVLMIAYPAEPIVAAAPPRELRAITFDDWRWSQCWIKSLMLLPNVLAKSRAQERGADEAIFHRQGVVTEGTSTSLAIVRQGEVWTHPADQWILGGITRSIVLRLAAGAGIAVRERTFSVEEMLRADEVFICGTTTHVAAVTRIDDRTIGAGAAGPVTSKLQRLLLDHIAAECGAAPATAAR